MSKYTPMLEQYLEIKKQYPDSLLFFRLGDFYELFLEDAQVASREMEIVLTGRDAGEAGRIPMCGIPHHSANTYIARLISRGYRIAICEQVEDPREAKGLVKREVTRIVTPGTVVEDNMLPESAYNYLAAVHIDDDAIGLAFVDVSSGDFRVSQWQGPHALEHLQAELMRLKPAECLISEDQPSLWTDDNGGLIPFSITKSTYPTGYHQARQQLLQYFRVATLESYGITNDYQWAVIAAAAIIDYLQTVRPGQLYHLQSIAIHKSNQYLDMDPATRRNLELTVSIREGSREGTLLSVIDHCRTSMGRRRLKSWIELPLKDLSAIRMRLDAVEELKNDLQLRSQVQELLKGVYDMERLAGKIGSQLVNPRDLTALKRSLAQLSSLGGLLQQAQSDLLQHIAAMDTLPDVLSLIDQAIDEDAPLTIKEGEIIKEGYRAEIDELRQFSREGSDWLINYENQEKERTGIKYLKVSYNKVFGYYIEISKSNLHLVPPDYHRKQTLVNTERFISDELKKYEDRIIGARERLFALEYQEYILIRDQLVGYLPRLQQTANLTADLDVLASLAEAAYTNNYVRPDLDNSGVIDIKAGRHPVVEKYLVNSRFVPNDVRLDVKGSSFAIITGPNMGGKSTYMRQTALLAVMAQMGSFVPAEQARLGLVDKLFTRVGASDDLSAGQSTFMVEMVEVAYILNNATSKSLIVLDEIGRGTSTYDGLSLAQAVTEYIVKSIGARSLFATHYHELTTLEKELPGVSNLSVSVQDSGESVVFLKKVLPGKADRSYGLHVAQLAGLRRDVIERAQQILLTLEKSVHEERTVRFAEQPSLFANEHPLVEKLRQLNMDELSPREALSILYEWKDQIG